MGCNGSKLDVANGNTKTTGYSLLRRRKSDVSGTKTSTTAAAAEPDVSAVKNAEAQKPSVGSGEEKSAAPEAEVKEIATNGEKEKEKEKDGKEVKGESPAEAEKENTVAASVAGGEANQSSSPIDGRVVANGVDWKEAGEAAKTDGEDDKVVIGVADVGENGEKPSGEDLKEPILVEPTTLLERVIASKERADAEEHAAAKQTTAEASTKGP